MHKNKCANYKFFFADLRMTTAREQHWTPRMSLWSTPKASAFLSPKKARESHTAGTSNQKSAFPVGLSFTGMERNTWVPSVCLALHTTGWICDIITLGFPFCSFSYLDRIALLPPRSSCLPSFHHHYPTPATPCLWWTFVWFYFANFTRSHIWVFLDMYRFKCTGLWV